MREIKFRAWDKTENKMVGWEELCDEDKNGSGYGESLADYFNAVFSNVEPLMQFTGLKDKNGREIYEGDLLSNGIHQAGEVIFKDGCFMVGHFNCELCKFAGSQKEVIGNIYENPELLEAK